MVIEDSTSIQPTGCVANDVKMRDAISSDIKMDEGEDGGSVGEDIIENHHTIEDHGMDIDPLPSTTTHETNNLATTTITENGDTMVRLDALARAFILDTNSEWMTVATGMVVCEMGGPDATIMTLTLNDESQPDTILFSTTFHHQGHREDEGEKCTRQQATVVTWTTADGSDVALSFESASSCDDFWYREYLLLFC